MLLFIIILSMFTILISRRKMKMGTDIGIGIGHKTYLFRYKSLFERLEIRLIWNFGRFLCSWIQIRIPNTRARRAKSMRIRINNTELLCARMLMPPKPKRVITRRGSKLHWEKRKENFPHILGNSDGIGFKVIYKEGFPNTWGMPKYLVILRKRQLIIYDFATAPVWISLYMRKNLFSFFSAVDSGFTS